MFRYLLNTPERPYFDFKIEEGKFDGIEIKSAQLSPCMEPSCSCANIYFTKVSDYQTDEYFAMDVEERSIKVYKNNKPSQNDLTLALTKEITENDWKDIYAFYFNLKVSLCEMVEPEKVNIEFTDDEIKNIESGIVFPYHEVFPWGMKFVTEFEDETYLLFDYYCLRPKCDCQEIIFYVESSQNSNHYFNGSFEYSTKKWQIDQISEDLSKEKADQILEKIKATTEEQLLTYIPHRHHRMRKIFELAAIRKINSKVQPETETKIGRNDPCPCGSGKKYKNCHG